MEEITPADMEKYEFDFRWTHSIKTLLRQFVNDTNRLTEQKDNYSIVIKFLIETFMEEIKALVKEKINFNIEMNKTISRWIENF